jgi:hypothetical protein
MAVLKISRMRIYLGHNAHLMACLKPSSASPLSSLNYFGRQFGKSTTQLMFKAVQ